MSFVNWYPTDALIGRAGGFGWECVGSSPGSAGLTNTQTETFTIGSRSLTVQFVFESLAVEPGHYSGESFAWNQINSASITASTGVWYNNETVNLVKTLSSNNPFRNNHPQLGTLTQAGPSYQITAVTGYTNNRFSIGTSGTLTVYTGSNTLLWTNGYSNTTEPLVVSGTVDPLRDVCGKRISSCKKRFGDYANLPFGSFPAAGTFYG
jgi:hypothetical protein